MVNGCAITKINSLSDPLYVNTEYKSTAIFVNYRGLKMRMLLEDGVTNRLNKYDVKCIQAYKLFPPTREFS